MVKWSISSTQPFYGNEVGALRKLQWNYPSVTICLSIESKRTASKGYDQRYHSAIRCISKPSIFYSCPHASPRLRLLPRLREYGYTNDSSLYWAILGTGIFNTPFATQNFRQGGLRVMAGVRQFQAEGCSTKIKKCSAFHHYTQMIALLK